MEVITIISTLPPVKGISPYTTELCKELSKRISIDFIGFNHIYPESLYPGGTKEKNSSPPNIKNLKNRSFISWYNPLTWIYAGLSAKSDIVHAQWWSHVLAPFYITILLFSRLKGKKVVLTVHNVTPHENNIVNELMNKSVFGMADKIIVHSKQNKEVLCEQYNIKAGKVGIIPHGLLQPAIIKNFSKEKSRKFFGLKSGDKVMLFFGNIRDYKGLDILIRAFKKIKIKNAKLIIAGKCWQDKSIYTKLIGKNKNIIFHEKFIPTGQIEYYFRAADLVVLPYKEFESASGVGSLVLPYDVPMIVSKVGSLPDLVKDQKNCVVEPGNVDDLTKKIEKIFSDEKLRKKAIKDIGLIKKGLSWDLIANKTLKLYDRVYKEFFS